MKKHILNDEQDQNLNDLILNENLTPKMIQVSSMKKISYKDSHNIYHKKKRDLFGF